MATAALPSTVADAAASLLFPRRCVLCSRSGSGLCRPCAATLPPGPDLDPPEGVDRCWSLLDYSGPCTVVVAALKYDNHRDAVAWLAAAMALLPERRPDVVTWAPTTRRRRAQRGFDQSELIARRVAAALRVPARRLLTKPPALAQTGASRLQRLATARFESVAHAAPHVLVIDDVRTTGATLSAAAAALRGAGATTVDALTLAVAP